MYRSRSSVASSAQCTSSKTTTVGGVRLRCWPRMPRTPDGAAPRPRERLDLAAEVGRHVEQRAERPRRGKRFARAPEERRRLPSRAASASTSDVLPTPASPETAATWPCVGMPPGAPDSEASAPSRSSSVVDRILGIRVTNGGPPTARRCRAHFYHEPCPSDVRNSLRCSRATPQSPLRRRTSWSSWGSSMLAVVPLWSPVAPPSPSPSCEVAIELHLKAPLQMAALQPASLAPRRGWQVRDVTGSAFAWASVPDRCTGWQVQLQALVRESRRRRDFSPPRGRASPRGRPSAKWGAGPDARAPMTF